MLIGAICLFVRFHTLGFSLTLPLLGAATVVARPTPRELAGVVTAAIAFHIFAYVLNDVVDLPVDRTEPQRATYPLVKGTIGRWQALGIALAQLPLALAVTAYLGGGAPAFAAIGSSFALMALYNLCGKRTRWPPLTDAAQATAWGALALYGALVVAGQTSRLTGVIVAFVVVFILMINGVHASLRDLPNDLARDMRTTAILAGVRPGNGIALYVPRRFSAYMWTLQALLTVVVMLPLVGNWLDYSPPAWALTAGVVLILNVASWLMLRGPASGAGSSLGIYLACLSHTYLWLVTLVALFALYVDGTLIALIVVAGTVTSGWTTGWVYRRAGWWQHFSLHRLRWSPIAPLHRLRRPRD